MKMNIEFQRRTLLKLIAAGVTSQALPPFAWASTVTKAQAAASGDIWKQADAIRRAVVEPVFPPRDFPLTRYGGRGDGKTDNTEAFRRAIKACTEAGGGRVVVEAGVYRTGPIHLKSGVNLHVVAGATVSFFTDPARYLPPVFTRWEGVELMGYSPLIYAFEETDIAVTGEGVLDGNADRDTWWPWKGNKEWGLEGVPGQSPGRKRLFEDAEKGVPPRERVYADGAYLRPPLIQPYRCRNVLIEGVTVTNSPFWLIHPVLSEHVTVRGVTCRSLGPNSDGCNPESCKNVLIQGCFFDTGDDCIAIKSGRNADGRRVNVPSENILVEDCQMRAGHGGVVIGSEISGGARNLFVQNCRMSSPDLERGIRIKTNSRRGGIIEHYYLRDIEIGDVRDAVVINFHYEEGDAGRFDPVVRDIRISNLTCRHARRAFYIRGFERAPIRNLTLNDVRFERVDRESVIEHVKNLQADNVVINGARPFEAGQARIGARRRG